MARNEDHDLARNVRVRMTALQMSADDVAEASGTDEEGQPRVSARTVANLVNRGWPPNLANIRAIADGLGCSLSELLGEAPPETDPRLAGFTAVAHQLSDGDIAALTSVARQIASARQPALPTRDDLPFWNQMTPQEQQAWERLEERARRANMLRAAAATSSGAGEPRESDQRRGGRRRRPGETAGS